ncbi:Sec-independent protein translocase protein TatB [Halopseudomonas pachastrellae]|uniref:Sec-independent protein translocase protein TatB n=1 Tax=Halopseudomonas pachastrellae TaxID=254161 RepID=UPI003D7CF99C
MFDIGFMEMLVVAIIALLVLGPERLPGAIRTVSLTIGRIKRGFSDVRSQVERELGADEIRQQLNNERILAELEKQGLHAGSPSNQTNARPSGNQSVTQPTHTGATAEQPRAESANEQQDTRHEQP